MELLKQNLGIIVQARIGSTRLPNKMVLDFNNGKSILEILLISLKESTSFNVILATTTKPEDDPLAILAEKIGLNVYRGDEQNVLKRFVEAAEMFNLNTIVRVCADNPFLNIELLKNLINNYTDESYFSYKYRNGKPTILGHMGLFCEVVSLAALKKTLNSTNDLLYLEHVTNYVYAHPEFFNVKLIDLPDAVAQYEDIRLTVDTQNDFEITRELHRKFPNTLTMVDALHMLNYIKSNSLLLSKMHQEILNNTK